MKALLDLTCQVPLLFPAHQLHLLSIALLVFNRYIISKHLKKAEYTKNLKNSIPFAVAFRAGQRISTNR